MKIWITALVIVFRLTDLVGWFGGDSYSDSIVPIEVNEAVEDVQSIYNACGLNELLDFQVFEIAYSGYTQLNPKSKPILTIIDYTKPSTEKRLFVIDLEQKTILHHTLVAHGKNSGANLATSFSNQKMSLKSSPGFYLTAETYSGKHGFSLRLDGLEKGINHNARTRAIVMHGANYVSPDFIKKYKRLGRSWGCPAVPKDLSKEIIDTIKDGSCLYIHTDDKTYLGKSLLAQHQ